VGVRGLRRGRRRTSAGSYAPPGQKPGRRVGSSFPSKSGSCTGPPYRWGRFRARLRRSRRGVPQQTPAAGA